MKKLILIVLSLMCFSSIAYSEDSPRIKELRDEGDRIMKLREQSLQNINGFEVRLIEINGAIKELQRSEDPKQEEKTETNNHE